MTFANIDVVTVFRALGLSLPSQARDRRLALLLEPDELPRLHVEHARQRDDRGEARVHRLAWVGLALLELLVGEGGDARAQGHVLLAHVVLVAQHAQALGEVSRVALLQLDVYPLAFHTPTFGQRPLAGYHVYMVII